ncbi:pilus assembly PilX N-terminal domain-containing protein [Marinobacterium sp. AK62]|uniref:Pilus assembly PilX N-terminal domain-containing protein n=1 Tax=Marinobacterium alkalitolerans TaxID=1542925 RepID=A0ABS3ZAZ8_9GAMM|nr:pilus assembly PilX N-terminal domain-containing protein [Marinobacterium alkalitolerans]MBP0048866.1 pilus assembly PilX N-terminal domain-containing protein [Marinobacterium alkalitolerans]
MKPHYKMSQPKSCAALKERGSVLIVGMVFLVILMIAGVTIMNSSIQDEKISGNSKRASDAFTAAEAGMEDALVKLWTQDESYNPPAWFYYTCSGGELTDPDGNVFEPDSNTTFIADTAFAGGSTYRVEYGGTCDSDAQGVTSISLVSNGTQVESLRRVHFNVADTGDASWPAVFVNDDPDAPSDPDACQFDFGPSSAYLYDGKGGPALSTNTQKCAEDIRDDDGDSGQLVGGVIANNPAPDFTDPNGLRAFYTALKASSHTQNVYPTPPKNANKGVEPVDLNSPDFSSVDLGQPGDADDPTDYDELQSLIIHGDLDMPGNLSGSGILVVTGTAHFGGTPNWDGVIIVLGGRVDIGGGGTTNGLRGTMIVSNLNFGGSEFCDEDGNCQTSETATYYAPTPLTTNWDHAGNPLIDWDVSGGGTARYSYGCKLLQKVNNFLLDSEAGGAGAGIDPDVSFPGPDSCPDPDGDGQTGTYGDLYVFDWYEEVGN